MTSKKAEPQSGDPAVQDFERAIGASNFKKALEIAQKNNLDEAKTQQAAEGEYAYLMERGEYRNAFAFGKENNIVPEKIGDSAAKVF